MCISPSILPSIQQLCPPPSKAIKTVISLFHRQAFHISFRERPESSPYLHGYYTVCMRVKTMGSAWWDHGTSFLRGHSGRHKDNPPAARRMGTVRNEGFLGHWAQGCEAGHPPVIRERRRGGGGGEEWCNGGEGSRSLGGGFWGPETKVSDWNSNSGPLFLLVYGNPWRTERCCCRMSTVLLVCRVGRRLAETARGGSARLKRIWQTEVTGPGREKEAGVAGRDSSLVTKTAGLRSRVSSFAFLTLLSSACSYLNFFLFTQSVRILKCILKALKKVFYSSGSSYKSVVPNPFGLWLFETKKCLPETHHRLHVTAFFSIFSCFIWITFRGLKNKITQQILENVWINKHNILWQNCCFSSFLLINL